MSLRFCRQDPPITIHPRQQCPTIANPSILLSLLNRLRHFRGILKGAGYKREGTKGTLGDPTGALKNARESWGGLRYLPPFTPPLNPDAGVPSMTPLSPALPGPTNFDVCYTLAKTCRKINLTNPPPSSPHLLLPVELNGPVTQLQTRRAEVATLQGPVNHDMTRH